MAPAQFPCSQCIVMDDSGIESHISAAHLNYFPFECSWCKETDQKYLAATKKHMTQHMAFCHNGKNSRYSVSEDNAKEVELKALTMECRRMRRNTDAPQIPSSDTKSALRRVLNVLGAATSNGYAAQNGSDPDDDDIIIIGDDDKTVTMPNDSLSCNLSTQSAEHQAECITKIEISDQNEQSAVQSNISSVNNEICHPVLPKTEYSVNISIADEIDSLISPSTSTGPPATVETQKFVTNPENNAPNAIILTKSEPSNSVSTVSIGLPLQSALSSCVPIDIDANEDQLNSAANNYRMPSILSKKQRYLADSSENFRRVLLQHQSAGHGPDVSTLLVERPTTNQASAYNSDGDQNRKIVKEQATAKSKTKSPRKKKAKKTKDPHAPKRGMSSYMLWLKDNRSHITKPGMSVTEISKAAGVEWNALKDKSKWEKAAAEEKKRYEKESEAYNKKKNLAALESMCESD